MSINYSTRKGLLYPVKFNPLDISGCKLWLDFSDANTLYTDAGTNKVTTDGQLIYQINDKSTNNKNFTQTTESKRPVYKLNIKNNNSASQWIDDEFMTCPTFSVNQPNTIITVAYVTANKYLFDGGTTRQLNEISNRNRVHVYAGTSVYSPSIITTPSYIIITTRFNGENSTVSINSSVDTTINPGTANLGGMYLGARNGGTNNHVGYFLEMIIYDTAITIADSARIKNYLNDKWAIY